jgi:hypothetical protein
MQPSTVSSLLSFANMGPRQAVPLRMQRILGLWAHLMQLNTTRPNL